MTKQKVQKKTIMVRTIAIVLAVVLALSVILMTVLK